MSVPGTGFQHAAGHDPAIAEVIAERGITEILHFTTAPPGFVGICATGMVHSRYRLEVAKYLEHIYTPNCPNRDKDADWTDYISLSISRVNNSMLGYSKGWHPGGGIWWVVLSFDPVILTHTGVHFVTTNNSYAATLRRAPGAAGLADMFSQAVPWGHHGSVHRRRAGTPAHWTTDIQAEVLYPGELSLQYLRAVYVAQDDHIDQVRAWLDVFPRTPVVPVTCKPEIFA
ncbi:DarT ssDNA thymidine ADP-ribosyltransferase family protein [Mycolicibacterium senegalense]|uniref:DarT ssDNA thymidine ADP-ribosyltransferase family protein n=1 Tax=Mycolicibacterium senegalense TaxID=1796 RepID=UPI003AAD1A77